MKTLTKNPKAGENNEITKGMRYILFGSDFHTLHPRVATEDIAKRTCKLIQEAFLAQPVHYFVIAGDFFDETRALCDTDVMQAQWFIVNIIKLCRARDVKLRVLEGTPLHDRHQSRQFTLINDSLSDQERCDLKYIDHIDVIHEADGSSWLYVPDPGRRDPDEVLKSIRDRLAQEGLEQVDFTVTHTMYRQHVPKGVHVMYHDPDAYLDLTKYLVDNGHIHTPSIYRKRFLTNGSVDRLKQGEDEPKGLWLAHVHPDPDQLYLQFLENKEATKHITLDCRDKDAEAVLAYVKTFIVDERKQFIRLLLTEEVYNKGLISSLRHLYPFIAWDKTIDRKDVLDDTEIDKLEFIDETEPLQPDNAVEVLTNYAKEKGKSEITPAHIALLDSIVKEVKW